MLNPLFFNDPFREDAIRFVTNRYILSGYNMYHGPVLTDNGTAGVSEFQSAISFWSLFQF